MDSKEYKFLEDLHETKDVNEYVKKWVNSEYFDYENVIEMCKFTDRIGFNKKTSLIGGMLDWMQRGSLQIFSLVTLQTCQRLKNLIDLYNADRKPVHIVDLGCGTGVNGLILQEILSNYFKTEVTFVDSGIRKIQTTVDIVKADYYNKTNFTKPNHFNICFMCWLDGTPEIDAGYDLLFCVGEEPGSCTGWIESDANYKVDMDLSLSISSVAYPDIPAGNRDYIGIPTTVEPKHKLINVAKHPNVPTLINAFNEMLETPEERKLREEMEIAGEIERDRRIDEEIEDLECDEDYDCNYKPEPDDLYQ